MRVQGLNHVELVLPADQLESAAKTFGALLGIAFPPPHAMPEQKIASSLCWEAGIEFVAPTAPDSPMQRALQRGNGIGAAGPIAWRVESVDAIREHALSLGLGIVFELNGEDGMRAIYLSPADCLGYTFSFIDRPGVPFPPPPPAGALFSRLNRVELLTTAEASRPVAAFLNRLLGTEIEIEYLAEHSVLTGTSWEAGVEVFAPGNETSTLHRSLAEKGERGGIGPIVWEVPDMDALKARASQGGHAVLYEFTTDERHQVCLRPETLFGYTATFTQDIG